MRSDDDDIIPPETVDELILRGNAKMTWKPSKTVELGVRLYRYCRQQQQYDGSRI